MKKITLISLISLLLLSGCKDNYKHLLKSGNANIILITGQSNASGNSPSQYLENLNSDVYVRYIDGFDQILTSFNVSHDHNNYFEPTRFGMADNAKFFGPEIGIAEAFKNEETPTYIIKYAVGGTTLDNQWLNSRGKRGNLYNKSINWFKEKLNYLKSNGVNPKIVGQFWMQGEGDSTYELGNKYEENLTSLISYYRTDLNAYYDNYYTFVDAYISTKTVWPKPEIVNSAKQNVADKDPHVFCIKTNGEDEAAIDLDIKSHKNEGDDIAHYDSMSELTLGKTAGEIILNQMKTFHCN